MKRATLSCITFALLAGCSKNGQSLPDASLQCGPPEACSGPVETSVATFEDPVTCSSNRPGPPLPNGAVSARSEGCVVATFQLTGTDRPFYYQSISNCCDEVRYLRLVVSGPISTLVLGDIEYPDPNVLPRIGTYALESGDEVLSPACRGGGLTCTSSAACAGVWTKAIPAGHTIAVSYLHPLEEHLEAPDDFLPERLVAYMPSLETSSTAIPTIPASAMLCPGDPRLECFDCPYFTAPLRLEVDLTQTEGVPEYVLDVFTRPE